MLTGLSTIGGRIYGVLSGLTFVAVTIPTICLLTITPGQRNRRKLVQKAAALIFFVTGVTPKVTGQEHLPVERCVVVANHASYLDGIILTAVLPPRFTFVIKREMTNVPFASFLLRRIGSEFVDRSDHQRSAIDTRRIMSAASSDHSLAFFPEGTFRSEAGLRSFHDGAFAVARRGKLKLVPVVIRGSREMLPAHRVLPARTKLEVIIRPSVSTDQAGASTRDLKETCRNSILEELNEPDTHR
jgi:1-acyl-sn-glycerol-3-phosphate acyltransferase